LKGLPYANGYDHFLFLFIGIPIQDNIFLPLGTLFLGSLLPLLRVSSFGIELSIQGDIEFYIQLGLILSVSFFNYIKVRMEDTGNCSHPCPYRWGFPAKLKLG